jgi:enoyl-CoA hydratase
MSDLIVEVKDGVQIMTLNRPEAKNAATLAMSQAMVEALDELDRRDDIRIGIVTGAGGTFCAGMDLKGFLRGERPSVQGRGFAGITEKPPRKPVIAAVEGYALAGGFEIVLACDLIVAANNSNFGLPEVKRSLVAAAGGLLRLPQRLPYHIAMEYILTGGMLPAAEAHRLGLVNHLTEPGQALEKALELAAAIAANGPLATAASKQIVVESSEWSREEMFQKQMEISGPVFTSEDAREGATAFAEKRAPVWKGK